MASADGFMSLEIQGKKAIIKAYDGVLTEIDEIKKGLNPLLKNKINPEGTAGFTRGSQIVIRKGIGGNDTMDVFSADKDVAGRIIVDSENKLKEYMREEAEDIAEIWSKK